MDLDGDSSGKASPDDVNSVNQSMIAEGSSGESTRMDVSDPCDGVEGLVDDGESFSAQNSDMDDDADEAADVLGEMGLNPDQLDEIERCKQQGMFVSAWEEDETGVDAKNLEDPNEQFLTAAEEGKVDVLTTMLRINPDFTKTRDKDNYTALHRAAYNNHTDAVRFLLEKGADPEARTSEGWTVLHSACAWGNYEVVGILLSHGVDINAVSNGHLHALHLAVNSQEDPEKVFHTVRYLLQAPGIDAGVQSGAGDTPLALARRSSRRLFELIERHFEKI